MSVTPDRRTGDQPLAALKFTSASAAVGYLKSRSLTVASSNAPFTTQSVAVDELRVFDGAPMAEIPEPSTWVMMIVGSGVIGLGMRRRGVVGGFETAAV